MLAIGDLDRRIKIESPTATTNNYGERTFTWATAYTVWAKIDWKRSNRKEESQELVQTSDLTFYIRNLGVTILGTYRILYDSKYYYINGIKEVDGREQFLELETKLKDNRE
tara:strand:+ start:103 stop:435 length:333 start_codon:yes stop_codon:yes gene_type:complete